MCCPVRAHLLALTLLAGCQQAPAGSLPSDMAATSQGADWSGADPITAACARLYAARAGYEARCFGGPYSQPPYEEGAVASCAGIATARGSQIVVADLDACAAAIEAGECWGFGTWPRCVSYRGLLWGYPDPARRGTGKGGDRCFASLQCQSGYCDAQLACGLCRVPRQVGESCDGANDVCTPISVCEAGVCTLSGKKRGAMCTTHGVECQSTLYCKAEMGFGTCQPKSLVGDPCGGANPPCNDGLTCQSGRCAVPESRPTLPVGASCQSTDRCAGYCVAGVCSPPKYGVLEHEHCEFARYCRNDFECSKGTCEVPMVVQRGGSCEFGGSPRCAAGLYCPCLPGGQCAGPKVCADLPALGEPCGPLGACALGSRCWLVSPQAGMRGVCTRLGQLGDPCPCANELWCAKGRCVPYGDTVCS
ncbi:MAG: hypothetical protein EXR72_00560 [Myxococcales bacterium]|nr:hypothetical protein [Myxococcales bacterium]